MHKRCSRSRTTLIPYRDFNRVFLETVDEVISEMLDREVLRSLYIALENRYDVTKDEIPYRLETAYKILEDVFGAQGSGTVTKRIAYRLYQKLDLEFEEVGGLRLMDYLEIAKRKLEQEQTSKQFLTSVEKLSTKRRGYRTEEKALTGLPDTSDMLVLKTLNEKKEMKIDEIAEQIGMPIPTTQRRVNEMLEKVFITRSIRINGTHYAITKLGKFCLLLYTRKPTKIDHDKNGKT